MGLLVLDEDFAHQLLWAGQGDARLQLQTDNMEQSDGKERGGAQLNYELKGDAYRVFVQRVNQQRFSKN